MSRIQERGSTHVYNVNKISKEEIDSMVDRCVYEQPAFCFFAERNTLPILDCSPKRATAASTARIATPSPHSPRRHVPSHGASQPCERISGKGAIFS